MSDMSTKISLRLSDDVLQAVDEAAEQGGRNRTQQIEWCLRIMLLPKFRTDVGLGDLPIPEKILEKPKIENGMCVHGREKKFCVYCQKTEKSK